MINGFVGALTVAGLEIKMGLRNRWVLATTLLMTALALSISLLGSAPIGAVKVDSLTLSVVSMASLTIFLVPLMALLLSFDSIVGEVEQGTMLLMLSYPVTRGEVVLGKFIGQAAIITFATLVGFGSAGLASALTSDIAPDAASWGALGQLIASASLLGSAFVALGLFCSVMVSQKGAAAGLAVSLWLFFVIVFDLVLLGSLTAGLDSALSTEVFNMILMINPADVFRMINMSDLAGSGMISGMTEATAGAGVTPETLWTSLSLWILIPLGLSVFRFNRRDL
jgi:Cu-processing system permease protein